MSINSTEKGILRVLWENEKANNNSILSKNDQQVRNVFLKKQAQLIATILPKIIPEPSETSHLSVKLDGNNEIEYLYQEWETNFTDSNSIDPEILIDFIIPYVKYEILYEDGGNLDIDFYNDETDLQQTSFFEIKNDVLILHTSVYLKRYHDSEPLIPSQAKLMVTFKNPFTVLN